MKIIKDICFADGLTYIEHKDDCSILNDHNGAIATINKDGKIKMIKKDESDNLNC
jgi:hypothetical protein